MPIHMDTECLEIQEHENKIILPTHNMHNDEINVPYIRSTKPKDSNTKESSDVLTYIRSTQPKDSNTKESSDVLTTFQESGVHFDPDIVPLSDTQTLNTFHTLPRCDVVDSSCS